MANGSDTRQRQGGSLQIGKVSGIPIRVHWTFPFLFAWVAYAFWGDGLAAVGQMMLIVLTVFGCVVLHEFGHALAARRYGIGTRDITLLPIGGVAKLEGMPESPGREIVVALAGPAVNVVIAGVLLVVLVGAGVANPFFAVPEGEVAAQAMPLGVAAFFWQIAMINVFLVVFNMIPAFPMDGGRVLRALLATAMNRPRATLIAARVGQVIAVLFIAAGLFLPVSPFLILIGVFVFFGGLAEARSVWFGDTVAGLRVGDAMMTDFDTLEADAPLARAAELLLAGSQTQFPVVEDGRVVGLLERDDLSGALSRLAEESPVRAGMRGIGPVLVVGQALAGAYAALRAEGASASPVVEGGRLVGLLTLENIEETIRLRMARRARRRSVESTRRSLS